MNYENYKVLTQQMMKLITSNLQQITLRHIYNFLISVDLLKVLLQKEKLLFLSIPYFISLEFQSQM